MQLGGHFPFKVHGLEAGVPDDFAVEVGVVNVYRLGVNFVVALYHNEQFGLSFAVVFFAPAIDWAIGGDGVDDGPIEGEKWYRVPFQGKRREAPPAAFQPGQYHAGVDIDQGANKDKPRC